MFNPNKFLKLFFSGLTFFSFLLLIYYYIAFNMGELNIENVVKKQTAHSSDRDIPLFNSGINQSLFSYKTALSESIKPEILALGSSRVMTLRGGFFKKRFVNMGGIVSNVENLNQFSQYIEKIITKPKLIILYIDPWWFNNSHKIQNPNIKYPDYVNSDHLYNFMKILFTQNIPNLYNNNNMGLYAIINNEGHAVDGSYYYLGLTRTKEQTNNSEDNGGIGFSRTLSKIDQNKSWFKRAKFADQNNITQACNAINAIKTNTDQLIMIAPPFPERVYKKLRQNSGYDYYDEVYQLLESCTNLALYNFENIKSISNSLDLDCEFIDGFHGGDTINARMLLEVRKKNENVNQFIDEEYLLSFLHSFEGFASGMSHNIFSEPTEVDFRRLGCKKTKKLLGVN